jgi:hypothetical protein
MKKIQIVGAVCAASVAASISCNKPDPGPTPSPSATVAEPVARPSDWYGDSTAKTIGLEQGWTPQEIEWFYTVTQGSELMPYDIFLALEQADAEELLRAPRNMQKFRYLVDFKTPKNPDDLPVGFVKNNESVGMVCAACHTTQINYKGTGIRIEGGPAMADFGGFMNALIASLDKTIQDTKKFDRFAARVLGAAADKKAALMERVKKVRDELVYSNTVNMRGVAPYGFARLDAFGRIYNRVITLVDKTNGNPANAPVSYPFLWDTSQHDYVQWPGNAPNANLGELQRNIGEVIGVFASITIDTPARQRAGPEGVCHLCEGMRQLPSADPEGRSQSRRARADVRVRHHQDGPDHGEQFGELQGQDGHPRREKVARHRRRPARQGGDRIRDPDKPRGRRPGKQH